MGFVFRVEQIAVSDEHTVLTGHMISGALDWHQRVEVQIEENLRTVFSAPLRGMSSGDDTGLTLFDPSLWEKVLSLPLPANREKQIALILDGVPAGGELPVPAIAVGIDTGSQAAERLQTTFRSADVPAWSGVNFGSPLRQYPYQISRRGMVLFAPWGLFFVTIVLLLFIVALEFNKLPGFGPGKIFACAMLGLFDVLFLYFSVKMLLAKPSPMVVTTLGVKTPVIQPGFTSQNVFVAFDEMDDVLEYWHDRSVQMLKLKTARGILHFNLFLMQAADFDELRRLLWRRVRDNNRQTSRPQVGAAEERVAFEAARQPTLAVSDVGELSLDELKTGVQPPRFS